MAQRRAAPVKATALAERRVIWRFRRFNAAQK